MKTFLQRTILFAVSALVAGQALAHAGPGHAHTLADGFVHPVTGWDHALVALVVGLIAAQWREYAWRLPALFIGGMTLGATAGVILPVGSWIESGIVLSMLAAGLLLSLPRQAAGGVLTAMAVVVIGFAGAAHGVVHGAEAGAQPLYLGGILAGTLMLHGTGIALGRLLASRPLLLRGIGVATAAIGVGVLVN